MFSANKYFSRLRNIVVASMLPALMAASCSDEIIDNPAEDGAEAGYITINLASSQLKTRAEADVDNLNENLIQNVWIFLGVSSATDSDVPVLAKKVEIGENTDATVKIPLTKAIVDQLSANGSSTSCQAYVICNLPDDPSSIETKNFGELRELPVSADFATKEAQPSFVMDGTSNLTISNNKITGSVNLTRAASKIKISVKVAENVQSKGVMWTPQPENMTVLIANGVKNSLVTPSKKSNFAVEDYYSTATNASDENHRARHLSRSSNANATYPFELVEPFYTFPNTWNEDGETMTYMTLMVPWKAENEENYRTCYYMVPVVRNEQSIGRNISYRVNIDVNILGSFTPDEPFKLENLSYRAVDWGQEGIGVDINDYRYLVVDRNEYVMNNEETINIPFYSSHNTIVTVHTTADGKDLPDVRMKFYRYNITNSGIETGIWVTPEQNELTGEMNNNRKMYDVTVSNIVSEQTNTRTLTFSHDLIQWNAKALKYNSSDEYDDFSLQNPVQIQNGTSGNWWGGSSPTYKTFTEADSLDISKTIAYFTPTQNVAYSKYEVWITIIHEDLLDQKDTTPFQRTIHIVQYPQMYIESKENKFTTQWNSSTPYGQPKLGNVYINNYPQYRNDGNVSNSGSSWYAPSGLTGGNRNPNMYIINVTQLNDNRYIIGDPRKTSVDNLNYDSWQTAPDLYGGNDRTLSYYYPTDDSDNKQFFIAPKFRVASSYGVSPTMSIDEAKRRCASYQELDCPAGRWRLPTYGEMEFIIKLSNQGKIPVLFSSDSRYWSAQGSASGQTGTDGNLGNLNTTDSHVRCVYDEWYWENVTPKLQSNGTWTSDNVTVPRYYFTWGDKQR